MCVVSAEASLSLTNVSEIPDDAELAETFYSQFDDEFENDESEDELDDEDDFSALMGQMQDALDQTASRDQTLGDADLPSEGLTDTWRHKRIQGLRAYPLHSLLKCLLTHEYGNPLSKWSACCRDLREGIQGKLTNGFFDPKLFHFIGPLVKLPRQTLFGLFRGYLWSSSWNNGIFRRGLP